MAWNEPGQGDKNNGSKPEGPPEIEKIFKDFSAKLAGMFGKKSTNASGGSSGDLPAKSLRPFVIGGIVVVVVIWALSGIFIVSPAEKAVVLQFGRFDKTVEPGPHWVARGIQTERTLNVQKVSTYSYGAQMLTKDQNIVDVAVAVQYKIADMRAYLYNVRNPDASLQQATASALRQVIGNTTLDQILTTGRAEVRQAVVTQLNSILAIYNTGIIVTDVALQPAQAPAEVKSAFDDAIKAQEDEQRYQNQAQAYANGVVPIAQGKAKRIIQEALAYQEQVVLQAQGDVARFNAIYDAYRTAPSITRERLYLAALQDVLTRSSKVYIDTKGSNNLLYLPMDQLMNSAKKTPSTAATQAAAPTTMTANTATSNQTTTSTSDDSPATATNPDSLVGSRGERP